MVSVRLTFAITYLFMTDCLPLSTTKSPAQALGLSQSVSRIKYITIRKLISFGIVVCESSYVPYLGSNILMIDDDGYLVELCMLNFFFSFFPLLVTYL